MDDLFGGGIRGCIRRVLPSDIRYWITVLLFWPTVLLARLRMWMSPWSRRPYDRVNEALVLGAVPAFEADVNSLVARERVVAVVNCCREWDAHSGANGVYERARLAALHLPTIDWDVPSLADMMTGVAFILAQSRRGGSVYVHCKAGRGRSTCVVLAYLCLAEGLSPREAHDAVASRRPHISKKWQCAEIQRLWRLRKALETRGVAAAFLRALSASGDCMVPGVAVVVKGRATLFDEGEVGE